MTEKHEFDQGLSRRNFLLNLMMAPVLLRSARLEGQQPDPPHAEAPGPGPISLSDVSYTPNYPTRSPLEGVLRLVSPGSDEYAEEGYAAQLEDLMSRWSGYLTGGRYEEIVPSLAGSIQASPFTPARIVRLRSGDAVESERHEFVENFASIQAKQFLLDLKGWIGHQAQVERSDFEITRIAVGTGSPLRVSSTVRFEFVVDQGKGRREQRAGMWAVDWERDAAQPQSVLWKLVRFQPRNEMRSSTAGTVFLDITESALGHTASYQQQMLGGSDDWRTALDGACGIDVYGNNGVAAGDYDNDGFDDLYISQPAGLPNRLYRNRGDGTFEDVTEAAGVGVLDNTSCALFADLRNSGLQDLVVVCGGGPLLFLNQGDGTFKVKQDAFRFAKSPQGTFTHAAISDYDRDGRLDIYFCVYSYYLGLDQYHYPVPYFDARNGPPNFLMHNEGDGTFVDRTEAAGLTVENDRYSFSCAWNESPSNRMPDLYVVNDFGRNNLYRNNGNGTFSAVSDKAHAEDVGAGMSACWMDSNNDGQNDIYVANMWSAAGLRVSQQDRFHPEAPESTRALYRRHAGGNALYEAQADGVFRSIGEQAGVDVGRWAWCSDSWDFDHDGHADIYVTNGYISALDREKKRAGGADLGSFFWRQLVAKSPNDATPSMAYEHGWNAINELIRSDHSWNGFERNAMFANNRDGTYSEVAGVTGLDLIEDSRSFALADFDHDGRLEVVVKNRSAPQLRVLHNSMSEIGDSIAFCLKGTRSNRDAIGTSISVEVGDLHQTKSLQAGSGFLAQHSKELFFGIGKTEAPIHATVCWPSGLTQQFEALPRNSRIHLQEGAREFTVKPFAKTTSLGNGPQAKKTNLPSTTGETVGTWLVDPLKAPAFALSDLSGATRHLQEFYGDVVLLTFWSSQSARSKALLQGLQRKRSSVETAHVKIVAINLDQPDQINDAKRFSGQEMSEIISLFATEEVAGIYNLAYRYLFDRRRNLPIPTSLLLDKNGMIVKVYQGLLNPGHVIADASAIPATVAERMKKALPFAGKLYQGEFVRNDFTYGVAMFQHGYLEQAEESFKQVVVNKPNDAEGYYNLGTLKLRKKDFPQARAYLEQTLKLRPNYPEAWNNLGMMAAQQGHPQEAIENFKQSLLLRPAYATALLNLGNVYRRQGAFAEAKDSLNRALELQPDDPEANYSLGMFYAQRGQLDAAENFLHKAADLRPDYPEALNNLGVISVRKQDFARAENQFKSCIQTAPRFEQGYLNLARLYLQEHDKPKARATLEQLLRLVPDSAAGKQGMQTLETTP